MLAWSQVDGLAAFYVLWVAIGLVMAIVLYEPAFTVLAKWFPAADERRRAMTALTLVAALASFIFLPLSQALIDAHGWRDALVILAVILGGVTIPLHALVLRRARTRGRDTRRPASARRRRAALAAVLAALGRVLPGDVHRDRDDRPRRSRSCSSAVTAPAFAAFAVGLIGISQIPGRVVFAAVGRRLPRRLAIAGVFVLIAAGIALIVGVDATAAVLAGLVCSAWATAWPRSRARPRSPTSTAPERTARSPASPPLHHRRPRRRARRRRRLRRRLRLHRAALDARRLRSRRGSARLPRGDPVTDIHLHHPQTLYRHWEEQQWNPFGSTSSRPRSMAG